MKKLTKGTLGLALMLAFALGSCAHEHAGEDHEGHDHSAHEGHDHSVHEHDAGAEDSHNHPGIIDFSAEQAKAVGLATETVEAAEFQGVIKTSGKVEPYSGGEKVVSAPSSGVVTFAQPGLVTGKAVRQGEALFRVSMNGIDDSDGYESARTAAQTAKTEYDRAKALYQDKLISQKEYIQAESAWKNAESALAAHGSHGRGGMSSASAPISGVLSSVDVRPGEYVTAGQPLGTVSQMQRLQLRAYVPTRRMAEAAAVNGANIVTGDSRIPLGDLKLSVRGTAPGASDGSGAVVTLEFDNPGHLASGAVVETYLLTAGRPGVVSVPEEALIEDQGLFYVFVNTGGMHYRKTGVQLGQSNGLRREIVSGLNPGDVVVVKGAYALKSAANAGSVPGHSHNH